MRHVQMLLFVNVNVRCSQLLSELVLNTAFCLTRHGTVNIDGPG